MVIDPDAIIGPRAVMVESLYALVANRAVKRGLRLYHFTVGAKIVQVLSIVEGFFN